jgi:hypothetical protein
VETAARRDAPLEALFEVVDEEAWKYLEENKSQIVFNAREGEDNPSAYEPVSVGLSVTAPDVDDNRIEYHPLHVAWRVSLQQPKSRWRRSRQPTTQARTVSTPGLRMTRYFPTAGTVTITASLVWKKKAAPIAIPSQVQFQVVGDRKYQRSSTLTGWSDYLVIMIGALFATATGIGTVYDATFGGFGQYLSLLAWAAGASTGANLFKEIGTTATFGGRTDVTLPTR